MVEDKVKSVDYESQTVGRIVALDYRKAIVFKRYGIDFCCGGKISIQEAAEGAGVDANEVMKDLIALDEVESRDIDFNQMPPIELVDHIVEKHHRYVSETIEQLQPMINKVAMVHGGWRPELEEIRDLFVDLSQELTSHMHKEEMVLFPAIKSIFGEENTNGFPISQINQPISMMEMEHDMAGDLMKKINKLSDGYTLPKGACATYTVVYKTLNEFEEDLHRHIHLENNILFPKALQAIANSCEL